MMYFLFGGIVSWFAFLGAIAWVTVYYRTRESKSINRKYVNVVDDTFRSISASLLAIEQAVLGLSRSNTDLSGVMSDFMRDFPGMVGNSLRPKDDSALDVYKTEPKKTPETFITSLEYVRDQFAETSVQKRVVGNIISKIKQKYGTTT